MTEEQKPDRVLTVQPVMVITVYRVTSSKEKPYLFTCEKPGEKIFRSELYEKFGLTVVKLRQYLAFWR